MKEKELIRLITAAQLYYEENMTQAEVAKAMGVSRPSVSNFLTKAREKGVVEISVKPFSSTTFGKARAIRERYGLKSCHVVETAEDKKEVERRICQEAVAVLLEQLPTTRVLGMGWGYNISRVVDAVMASKLEGRYTGQVCPLIGTATVPHRGYHPNELCTDLARKTAMTPEFLISPAFPDSFQEYRLFANTQNYAAIYALWKRVDTALVTLGGYPCVPDHATASRFGRRLKSERAVGNMLSYFFNIKGERIEGEDDYAIQIPLKGLGRIRHFIGIAPVGGSAAAVIGNLNTGVVKHLIIDEDMAGEVLTRSSVD